MDVKCEVCSSSSIQRIDGIYKCLNCGVQYSLEDLRAMMQKKKSDELIRKAQAFETAPLEDGDISIEQLVECRDRLQAYIEQSKKEGSGNTFRCVRKKPEYRKTSTDKKEEPKNVELPKLQEIIGMPYFNKPNTYFTSQLSFGHIVKNNSLWMNDYYYFDTELYIDKCDAYYKFQPYAKYFPRYSQNYAYIAFDKYFYICGKYNMKHIVSYNKETHKQQTSSEYDAILFQDGDVLIRSDTEKGSGYLQNIIDCVLYFLDHIAPNSVIEKDYRDKDKSELLKKLLDIPEFNKAITNKCKSKNITIDLEGTWRYEIISKEFFRERYEDKTSQHCERDYETCTRYYYNVYRVQYADGRIGTVEEQTREEVQQEKYLDKLIYIKR